jgi:hypothetical protein
VAVDTVPSRLTLLGSAATPAEGMRSSATSATLRTTARTPVVSHGLGDRRQRTTVLLHTVVPPLIAPELPTDLVKDATIFPHVQSNAIWVYSQTILERTHVPISCVAAASIPFVTA